jgi:hypothetical protein
MRWPSPVTLPGPIPGPSFSCGLCLGSSYLYPGGANGFKLMDLSRRSHGDPGSLFLGPLSLQVPGSNGSAGFLITLLRAATAAAAY